MCSSFTSIGRPFSKIKSEIASSFSSFEFSLNFFINSIDISSPSFVFGGRGFGFGSFSFFSSSSASSSSSSFSSISSSTSTSSSSSSGFSFFFGSFDFDFCVVSTVSSWSFKSFVVFSLVVILLYKL